MNLRALRTPIAHAGAITPARVPASADVALTLIHRHGCVSLQNLADLLGCSKVYAHRVAQRLLAAGSVRSERFKCRDRWRIRYLPVMPGQAARQPARAA
jgi:predicted ArsR family transcriptional regulator